MYRKLSLITVLLACWSALYGQVADRVENIASFARIYGVARWWVPSDEAQDVDWNNFVITGLRNVIDCGTREELAKRLEHTFEGIIPMFSVDTVPESAMLEEYYSGMHDGQAKVRWQHYGVELGPMSNNYVSRRLNRPYSSRNLGRFAFFGYLPSEISDTDTLTFEMECRGYDTSDSMSASVYFGSYLSDTREYSTALYRDTVNFIALSSNWNTVSISQVLPERTTDRHIQWGIYPEDGSIISVRSIRILSGSGTVLYSIDCSDGFDSVAYQCRIGYRTYYYMEKDGALLAFGRDDVFADTEQRTHVDIELPLQLYAHVPLVLYGNQESACPVLKQTCACQAGDADIANLADIVVMWNVIKYFSPYLNESGLDWDVELLSAIACFIESPSEGSNVLRRMLAKIKDAHVDYQNVHPDLGQKVFPAELTYLDSQVVAATPMDDRLYTGDIILSINGKDATEWIEDIISQESASRHTAIYRLWRYPYNVDSSKIRCRVLRNGKQYTVKVDGIAAGQYFRNYWKVKTGNLRRSEWLDDRICYFNLAVSSLNEIEGLLGKRTSDSRLIIDMRNGTSGFLARQILRYVSPDYADVIPDGQSYIPMSSFPKTPSPSFDISRTSPMAKDPDKDIIYIVGPGNASNEENFLDFVKHRGIGYIIGEPTAGISGAFNMAFLPSGLEVMFTGQRSYSQSGMEEDFYVNGVQPHLIVETAVGDIAAGRDPQFDTALMIAREGL